MFRERLGAAGMTGFEPAVSALTGQRVGPLHYTPEPGKSTIGHRAPDPLDHPLDRGVIDPIVNDEPHAVRVTCGQFHSSVGQRLD